MLRRHKSSPKLSSRHRGMLPSLKQLRAEDNPPSRENIVQRDGCLRKAGCFVATAALLFIVLAGAAYGLLMTEALDDSLGSNDIYLQLKAIVNPPKPVVVHQDTFETARGGDYTIVGRCDVRNDGGGGWIQVTARLTAYGQRLTKSKTIYLKSEESKAIEFSFPEVSVQYRILEGILSYLTGGGLRSVTNPDVDLYITAVPAR